MSADLSYKLHTLTPFSINHAHAGTSKVSEKRKMSREKCQTATYIQITLLIFHRFTTSSDSFPFIASCSDRWRQAFVKVKITLRTPWYNQPIYQFGTLCCSFGMECSISTPAVMAKCKASGDLGEIWLNIWRLCVETDFQSYRKLLFVLRNIKDFPSVKCWI